MFNHKSILYEVNPFLKIGCYIFFLLLVIFIHRSLYVVAFFAITYLLTGADELLQKTSAIGTGISLVTVFYPQLLWITKLGMLILYTMVLIKITNAEHLKYIVEKVFYRFQNKEITYVLTYSINYYKFLKENYQKIDRIRKEYGLEKKPEYQKTILKKARQKAKKEVAEVMTIYQLRFYNLYRTKTYYQKPSWARWDSDYLLGHIALFVTILLLGW